MNSTPYLPALRHQLGRFASTLSALQNAPLPQLQLLLSSLLPAHLLSANDDGAHSRERIFSLRRVFFAFLWQVLNPAAACREALRQLQAEARLLGASLSDSDDTSAYCQARRRLPTELLERILRHTAQLAGQRVADGQLWFGREVKLADGTTVSMPDTPENQHTVTYALNGTDDSTEVTITQDNNANEKEKAESEQNWRTVLDGMKKLLEG